MEPAAYSLATEARQQGRVAALCHSPLRLCVACATFNALLFALVLTTTSRCFDSGDDPAMMQMASGAMTGAPTDRLVFTNVLIGRVLRQLYSYWPSVNWYAYYLLAVHYLASTALLCAFVRLERTARAICAYLLLFAVFEVRLLLEFQFTSTALLAGFSGAVLLLSDALLTVRRPTAASICGGGLVALSAMIRVDSFYFAMLITAPLVVVALWKPVSPAALLGRYGERLWPFAVSLTLALGAVQYDHWSYSRDPQWQAFREYQAVRAPLYDYSVLPYVPNARFFYDRTGWSHNDFNMFQNYYLADERLSDQETLTALSKRFGRVGRSSSGARGYRKTY